MDDLRLGTAFRTLRQRRGLTQGELGEAADVSRATISRIECGHLATFSVEVLRRVAAELDMRIDLTGRWRAGELDRLLNRRHSALHEAVAEWLGGEAPDWLLSPEVSFNVFGERGIIDVLCWHPTRRALLVIELKTDIADVNELVGTVDRKRRLAWVVAKERGWIPDSVSVWVIVAPSRTNRRRVEAHRSMLRAAFPAYGRTVRGWLRAPEGSVAALSAWSDSRERNVRSGSAPIRRVRRAESRSEAAGRDASGRGESRSGGRSRPNVPGA